MYDFFLTSNNKIRVRGFTQRLHDYFKLQVYSNLSGLVILTAEGLIETCNANFINLLLGYSAMDLQGKVQCTKYKHSLFFVTSIFLFRASLK